MSTTNDPQTMHQGGAGRTLTPDRDVIVVGARNAAFATAVSARENSAQRVAVQGTPLQARRGGNTDSIDASLRLSFDNPREIAPSVPGIARDVDAEPKSIAPLLEQLGRIEELGNIADLMRPCERQIATRRIAR
jgi:hypothetical protein